jgi:hypothetical protein
LSARLRLNPVAASWRSKAQYCALLPASVGIITALEKIVKAFEDMIQVQLIKKRWEEIKGLQVLYSPLKLT